MKTNKIKNDSKREKVEISNSNKKKTNMKNKKKWMKMIWNENQNL